MAKEVHRHVTEENIQMANKHMKKYSTSLAVRKMPIKTTMRYHHTPARMAKIKYSNNTKCWRKCREIGSLIPCWWECKAIQPFWKIIWQFLLKVKMDLTYYSAVILLGIYLREMKTYVHKNLHTNVRGSFIC